MSKCGYDPTDKATYKVTNCCSCKHDGEKFLPPFSYCAQCLAAKVNDQCGTSEACEKCGWEEK